MCSFLAEWQRWEAQDYSFAMQQKAVERVDAARVSCSYENAERKIISYTA